MIVAEPELRRLLALKLRMPLFEERANSLATVFRWKTPHLFPHLIVESLREFLFFAGKKRSLHGADGQRRAMSYFSRERRRFSFKLRGGNHLIEKPDSECGLRINQIAGVEKLRRFRRSHQFRQKKCSAIIGK